LGHRQLKITLKHRASDSERVPEAAGSRYGHINIQVPVTSVVQPAKTEQSRAEQSRAEQSRLATGTPLKSNTPSWSSHASQDIHPSASVAASALHLRCNLHRLDSRYGTDTDTALLTRTSFFFCLALPYPASTCLPASYDQAKPYEIPTHHEEVEHISKRFSDSQILRFSRV
jgi:hypothetical protein